jgi:hypothetical protein
VQRIRKSGPQPIVEVMALRPAPMAVRGKPQMAANMRCNMEGTGVAAHDAKVTPPTAPIQRPALIVLRRWAVGKGSDRRNYMILLRNLTNARDGCENGAFSTSPMRDPRKARAGPRTARGWPGRRSGEGVPLRISRPPNLRPRAPLRFSSIFFSTVLLTLCYSLARTD